MLQRNKRLRKWREKRPHDNITAPPRRRHFSAVSPNVLLVTGSSVVLVNMWARGKDMKMEGANLIGGENTAESAGRT